MEQAGLDDVEFDGRRSASEWQDHFDKEFGSEENGDLTYTKDSADYIDEDEQ